MVEERRYISGHREGGSPGEGTGLFQRAHPVGGGHEPRGSEDVLLEEVLRVEGDVQEEPGHGGAEQLRPVIAEHATETEREVEKGGMEVRTEERTEGKKSAI